MRYSKKPKYNTGGQIGSALGSTATTFIPGVGPLLAPIGGMIGGMLGKTLYKDKEPEMPKNIAYGNMGYKYGGKVQSLGKRAKKFVGPKHEDGGILIDEQGNPVNQQEAIAEVEGGETMQNDYIFSDELLVPDTDMTFADAHEMLIAEGADEQEIQQLMQMQEQVRAESGVADNVETPMMVEEQPMEMMQGGNLPKYAYGSKMLKYPNGGNLPKYQDGGNPSNMMTWGRGAVDRLKNLNINGQPNIGGQLLNNAINRYSSSPNVTTNGQLTTTVQQPVTQASTVVPTTTTSRNIAQQVIEQPKDTLGVGNGRSIAHVPGRRLNPYFNSRGERGRVSPTNVKIASTETPQNVSNKLSFEPQSTSGPNWGNIATGLQSATRLGAALFAPRPKASPRATYNPLSTTSPSFANARRQAGSGFRTAMGTNPQAAYAQYLDATSNIASQEADFRSQREGINEQMRQATERTNMEQTMRDNDARSQDLAARIGLVTQAVDIPVTKMARDEAMKKQLMGDLMISADRISDPIERRRAVERRAKLLGIPSSMIDELDIDNLKYGGMIKRADGSYSKRGLWDNIRANRGSGKKPTKQMLKQEAKIKAKG